MLFFALVELKQYKTQYYITFEICGGKKCGLTKAIVKLEQNKVHVICEAQEQMLE